MTSSFQKLRSKHPFWQNRTRWWSSILHKVPPQALTVGLVRFTEGDSDGRVFRSEKSLRHTLVINKVPWWPQIFRATKVPVQIKWLPKQELFLKHFALQMEGVTSGCGSHQRRKWRMYVGACAAWLLARTAASIEFPLLFFEGPIARNASKHEPSSRKQCACLIACTIHVSSDFGLCKVRNSQTKLESLWCQIYSEVARLHSPLSAYMGWHTGCLYSYTYKKIRTQCVDYISVHIVIWSPHHPWHLTVLSNLSRE